MNISVEKVQFENDEESLAVLLQNNIDVSGKKLEILKVCGDMMFLVYRLPKVAHKQYIVQKISLDAPDVVITLSVAAGSGAAVKYHLLDRVLSVFKLYNSPDNLPNYIVIKTGSHAKQNGVQNFQYYLLNNENSDTMVPLLQLNKRNLDITVFSNIFNGSVLFGTSSGKIYLYNIETNALVKLNQYSAAIYGIHYASNVVTLIVGVTVMKYTDVPDILKFSSELIPNEIENYSSDSSSAESSTHLSRLTNVLFKDNLRTGGYVVSYADELVFNNYGAPLGSGTILLKQLFLDNSELVACCLSEYHLLCITNNNKLCIINQLDIEKNLVNQLEDVEGSILGLDVDFYKKKGSAQSTYWFYDDSNNVFEIVIEDEYKNVVADLVKQNRYSEVLAFDLKDNVLIQNTYNQYFNHLISSPDCDMDKVISIAGKIHANFTSVIAAVMEKLQKTESNDDVIMKLVRLLKDRMANFHTNLSENQRKIYLSLMVYLLSQLQSTLTNDKLVREFLLQNYNGLDASLTKNLLTNSPQNLVFYLKLIKDYKSLINYYLTKNNNFLEAIKVISVYCDDPECIYETAGILLMNCPEETVKTWAKLITNKIVKIDVELLLTSLLDYFYNIYQDVNGTGKKNHALWFLSWFNTTFDSTNKKINDYIVTMLFLDNKNYDVDRLLTFLNENWDNINQFLLLNLVQKNKDDSKLDVRIYILNKLQMHENSLNICLKAGLFDLAKEVISSIDDDVLLALDSENPSKNVQGLKKKLWLLFAKHIITDSYSNKVNLKGVISDLLTDSEGILTILDIFPIINQLNITVAVIKGEFMNNLKHESDMLSETSKEIEALVDLKKTMLRDIDYLTLNYRQEIHESDTCDCCGDNLILKKKFYCFPCYHKIHVNCVLDIILKGGDFTLKNSVETIMFKKEKNWLNDLNTLLGKKCPLCTDININNIDEPFDLEIKNSKNADNQLLLGSVGNIGIDYLKL